MTEQVKYIRQNISHSFTDYAGPSQGTLMKRLVGGPKELEVINRVNYGNDGAYDHPVVFDQFDVHTRGAMYERREIFDILKKDSTTRFDTRLDANEESIDKFNDRGIKDMCKYFNGKRYLVEISVYGGVIHYFGVRDYLRMFFPDDSNGSKILVTHHFDPFHPCYRIKNGDHVRYLGILPREGPGAREGDKWFNHQFRFCIKVRNMACKLLQSPELVLFAERINSIKKEALQALKNGFAAAETPEGNSVFETLETESNSLVVGQDIVVGVEDEELALLNRLRGQKRELEVILIAGMAGIGKTTMARRLYKNPLIVHHFHVRAWASVSQVYQKGNVLQKLLQHLIHDKESLSQMSDEAMGVRLYKCLKGKRFLIVIDDIWDTGVWNDLKIFFPNDENGSKVLMTSRIKDVAVNDNNNFPPHCLRLLSEDESWNLFEQKVFGSESCPQELMEMGKNIMEKCKGLPLAIVVVCGLIAKKDKTREWWQQIAENIGSYLDTDAEKIMSILELSYEHLPQPLKSCFLYFGAFPEDYEISTTKLVRMWIAEGFIQQMEGKRLEDTAEKYLGDLVARSLVMVSRRRSDDGIKTCLVHDMLRKLCVRKAHETHFMLPNYGYQECSSSPFVGLDILETDYQPQTFIDFFRRDSILNFDFAPSLLVSWQSCEEHFQLRCRVLRVMDLRCIIKGKFRQKVLELGRLKYLTLYLETMPSLPQEIYRLWNLETLSIDVEKGGNVTLQQSIWTMFKLRHLHISPEFKFETPWPNSGGPSLSSDEELNHPCPNFPSPLVLHNLQTLSWLCPLGHSRDILLARIPNVRNLGCHITLSSSENPFNFFDLSSLNVLEKLKFEYQTYGMVPVTMSSPDKFPSSLKKLTLVGSHVNWEEMSIIGMLPNLEVLKVKDNFFSGRKWQTCEGGFQRLRFLKFSHMDFQEWIATADDFPRLEVLVLNGCLELAEIPSAIGDVCTLQVIEVYRSSDTVTDSACQIQESQRNWGNDEFKLFIYQHFQDNISL